MSNKTNPLENLEEELVDYVSNTPNNTNPSVVKSMVRAAADGVFGGAYVLRPTTAEIDMDGRGIDTIMITMNADDMLKAVEQGKTVYMKLPDVPGRLLVTCVITDTNETEPGDYRIWVNRGDQIGMVQYMNKTIWFITNTGDYTPEW